MSNDIKEFLNETGMSQYLLANKLDVSRSTIHNWIGSKPRYPKMTKLALDKLRANIRRKQRREERAK